MSAQGTPAQVYCMNILGHTFEDYMEMVKRFHGSPAPGVLIGGFMVDLAVRNLPEGILYDAICETRSCLPDAIQLLTPCTAGNAWLKVINLGRYALTLYDKDKESGHKGVRVFLDTEKVRAWPEINAWFFKLNPSKEQGRVELLRQIKEAGEAILGLQRVSVKPQFTVKQHKGRISVCPECREAYPADDGETCLSCQGNALYL
ncbi:MAG TPA: formylmethanofuran dehydrogenase subunit E family protein [Syntrophorhabdaceae bacterium]|nr:formylmethanofuran dehydrogenase subunit E family protein [Syntrophorhabdaceae bacterium]